MIYLGIFCLTCVLLLSYGSDFEFLWYACVCAPAFAHPAVCISHAFPFASVFFVLFLFSVCFLCFILVCLLSVYFLKKERKKTWSLVGRKELGKEEAGETIIRIYFMKNKLLSNKIEKKKKS